VSSNGNLKPRMAGFIVSRIIFPYNNIVCKFTS
jgi:hypothetical protein